MVEEKTFDEERGLYLVTFNPYRFQRKRRRLLLTGTFNHWNYEHAGVAGLYMGQVEPDPVAIFLKAGYYEYKYYNLESNEWAEPERDPEIYWGEPENFCWNPFGTRNCCLRLG